MFVQHMYISHGKVSLLMLGMYMHIVYRGQCKEGMKEGDHISHDQGFPIWRVQRMEECSV